MYQDIYYEFKDRKVDSCLIAEKYFMWFSQLSCRFGDFSLSIALCFFLHERNLGNQLSLANEKHDHWTHQAPKSQMVITNMRLETSGRYYRYRAPIFWNMVDEDTTSKDSVAFFSRSPYQPFLHLVELFQYHYCNCTCIL